MKKKKHRGVKKTAIFITTVILFLIIIRAVVFFISQYKTSVWDGKTNLAIAFRADGDYFVLLNNFQKKLYVIGIPQNTVINYHNSQNYTLDAIWKLGEIDADKKSRYMKAMQSLFGYPIRVWYENKNINLDNFDIKMVDIFARRTNLSTFDYLMIKSKTYKVIKRSLADYVDPKILKIKDEVRYQFDGASLDEKFANVFEDVGLSNLGYRVQIKMRSYEQNQKNEISRIVNNVGWKVADIEFNDNVPKTNQCILKTKTGIEFLIQAMFSCDLTFQEKALYDLIIVAGKNPGS